MTYLEKQRKRSAYYREIAKRTDKRIRSIKRQFQSYEEQGAEQFAAHNKNPGRSTAHADRGDETH